MMLPSNKVVGLLIAAYASEYESAYAKTKIEELIEVFQSAAMRWEIEADEEPSKGQSDLKRKNADIVGELAVMLEERIG